MTTHPHLSELPPPPPGRSGWPWTEASTALPETMPDGSAWPRVTVVTPSFNQARYVEATLRSILLQGYPNLELIVMDGGSQDGSVEIIKKYEPWLTHWVSEPDGGQSAAINRGLRRGSGAFATWINSDDMLERNALTNHATREGFDTSKVYVGDCLYINEHDEPQFVHRGRVHTLEDLLNVRDVWRSKTAKGHIVQPDVLFPRELVLQLGALNENNHRTMDVELWGRLFLAGATFQYTHIRFGIFRVHGQQKTSQAWATTQSLIATLRKLAAEAPGFSDSARMQIIADLRAYERDYWLETGPLARIGLPESVVLPWREFEAGLRRRAAGILRRAAV
jgi:GT2 family glycosyltransferase